MTTRPHQTHLYGLDLLRIVAASLVLLNHLALFGKDRANGFATGSDAAFPTLSVFAETGAVGVQIFFVISGFVIAMSANGASAVHFAKQRLIRIAPTLWTCALIAFVVRALYGEDVEALLGDLLRSVILSPVGPYIDGVVWTLVVEAVFYALVFVTISARSHISLEHVALVLGVASAVFLVVFAITAIGGMTELHTLLNRFFFKVSLLRHGVFFSAGMLLFSIHVAGRKPWKLMAIACFCAFGLVEIAVSSATTTTAVMRMILWLFGMAAILASLRFAPQIDMALTRRHGLVRDLGRLSYPLYLNHYSLGMVLVPTLFAYGLMPVAALAVTLAVIICSSWLVMRWPEAAGQKALRALLLTPVAGTASNRTRRA